MKILVNGLQAELKKDTSFEYVSENPLFTEAEDYSMEIEFPLKDCPENIAIFGALHVKTKDIGVTSYPCEIICDAFHKSGILTITSVSETIVGGQFLEGMSQQNFASSLPDLYITDIDFSDYDGTDGTAESINRVMGDGWNNMVVWDEKKGQPIYYQEGWGGVGGWTCRHIYLYHLIELIALKCGYTVDDAALRNIPMYTKVSVVNTAYAIYDRSGYNAFPSLARSLPHWTVKQFFTEVGNFFGCVYEIDNSLNVIRFTAYSQLTSTTSNARQIALKVNDDFGIELQGSDEASFKGNMKYKLPDACDPGKINHGGWVLSVGYLCYQMVKTKSEMQGLLQAAAWSSAMDVMELENSKKTVYHISDKNFDLVITEYLAWSHEGYDEETEGHPEYLFCEFEPLGLYGDNVEGTELGIAPCPLKMRRIMNKPTVDGSPGTERTYSYAYRMPTISVPLDRYTEFRNNDAVPTDEILDVLNNGEENEKEYFSQLWVVLHSGIMDQKGYYLNTRVIEPGADNDYLSGFEPIYQAQEGTGDVPNYNYDMTEHDYNLVPTDPSIQALAALPTVDETKLYRFKFLSRTLYDPKSIFVIRNKKFVCKKLTAHMTVDGMSELIEGEFYEITAGA